TLCFSFQLSVVPRYLPSFPTRRSSDLGPFGLSGTDAVVIVGILARWAIFASAVTFERSTGSPMSFTSWNSPLRWSISSRTASLGSIIHLLTLAIAFSSGLGFGLGGRSVRPLIAAGEA